MIKKKIEEEVNNQIQAEFQSAYTYLAASARFETQNLSGFAHWMKLQWEEEIEHGLKFYNHLIRREGEPVLQSIEAPVVDAETPKAIFEKALEQERNITKRIHKLYDLVQKQGDYPLESLLLWFIDEQVEEEEQVQNIIDKLQLIKEDGPGLFLLDKELGERSTEK